MLSEFNLGNLKKSQNLYEKSQKSRHNGEKTPKIPDLTKYFCITKVHVPDPKTHYENVVGVQSWKSKKELESLREEPKRETWSRHPAIVNAWYSPNKNSVSK